MRILVSDTSVLIDLERGQLLEATFGLAWELAVPDLLYKRELRSHNGPELLRLGLRIESLDGDGVQTALNYQTRVPALTLADSFALALAKINNWTLLAGDGELRKLAATEAVDYHGVLWVFDQLLTQRGDAAEKLHRSLTIIANHPRCRLPMRDVRERLEQYARLTRGGT
jgi:predicted nucleic acid-binding protein